MKAQNKDIIREGFQILRQSNVNLMILLSKKGFGKSYSIDQCIEGNKDCIVFGGFSSESKFYEFLFENSEKTIIFRDCSHMLKNLNFINFIKIASEIKKDREISRLVQREESSNIPDKFVFKGKLIIELNVIPKKYKEDIEAVISRALFIELIFSREEMIEKLNEIAKTPREKKITNYLIEKSDDLDTEISPRMQKICFEINDLNKIGLFLKWNFSEPRKLLYELSGDKPVRRMEYIKYIMSQKGWSLATTHRKVSDWVELGEIYSDGRQKQANLSIKPLHVI